MIVKEYSIKLICYLFMLIYIYMCLVSYSTMIAFHYSSGGIGSGPGSSGSSTAVLSGQSALMEIEKLLLKFDGIEI
jgi:hypothetical protein